jgi:hypothetical protein
LSVLVLPNAKGICGCVSAKYITESRGRSRHATLSQPLRSIPATQTYTGTANILSRFTRVAGQTRGGYNQRASFCRSGSALESLSKSEEWSVQNYFLELFDVVACVMLQPAQACNGLEQLLWTIVLVSINASSMP